MQKLVYRSLAGLAAVALLATLGAGAATAQPLDTFRVTITNVTYGQILSPPVVVTHAIGTSIFSPGSPASEELAAVAEDAVNDPLLAVLGDDPNVADLAVGMGPILPGASMTFEVAAGGRFTRLSTVGMLVTTNDAFFGLDGVIITGRPWMKHFAAPAYDAGSEFNSEDCGFIPGPPCGNGGVRDTGDAEGFVHVHRGIQGNADLDPDLHDWRNPVAKITVVRING